MDFIRMNSCKDKEDILIFQIIIINNLHFLDFLFPFDKYCIHFAPFFIQKVGI